MDETSKKHIKETRIPLALKVANLEKFDYEYESNDVSILFMLFAPLDGLAACQVHKPAHENRLGTFNQGIGR